MAYLIDHPPVRSQFYAKRNRPLTGCTVLHTAESVMDTVGPDTGAEAVAEFIRRRTTAGSYHDLADSDSYLTVVPYKAGAFHDGTGSNNWALSISFACRTSDWRRMTPGKRAAFLRNGARAFAAQQAWRRANGHPLTELRYITKAQSDAGWSGFIEHGKRDPGRRSDPGISPPNLFPYDEWLDHCRAALAGAPLEEDDMPQVISHHVPPGEEHVYPIPPVQDGEAGWGKAWLSLLVDRFGDDGAPVPVRVGILDAGGHYRPLPGLPMDTALPPGHRHAFELAKGDHGLVVTASDPNHGVGVMVEYAKRS